MSEEKYNADHQVYCGTPANEKRCPRFQALRARVERMEKVDEMWQGMENAPKDGSTFLIRYPNQGNTLDLCYWVKIHNQWRSRGVLVFPDIQGCEWFPLSRITALTPEKAKSEGHDEDCPCFGDDVEHAADCGNCECQPTPTKSSEEK